MQTDTPQNLTHMLHIRLVRAVARCDGVMAPRLTGCLPQIVALTAQSPEKAIAQLREPIHRIVFERCEPVGEGEVCLCDGQGVDRIVDVIMTELVAHRQVARRRGISYPTATASTWFG